MEYIYIETYGCSANRNNSEILAGILRNSGYYITSNPEIAEIIIVNTCIVKGKTESKIKRRIQDLAAGYPGKLMIITGCMPETDSKQVKKLNENAVFLGTHHLKDIAGLIRKSRENKLGWEEQNKYLDYRKEQKISLPKIPDNKLISITQISEGCFGNCSYCKTRLAKGKLFSYDMGKIINSVQSDLKNKAKEIWLTSQDNANYGTDRGKHELPELLAKILGLKHRFRLRLGMMDPNNVLLILDELIEIYKNPKMYKFLHLPIQSASNSVLRDMNRLYTIEQAEGIISRFRKEIPGITISTDIIAGYPAEKQKDHLKNLEFIKKFKPDVFNLSKMSIHKKTPAEKLKPLPTKTINSRTSELMELHRQTALEKKQKFLGKIIGAFVNKKLPGFYEARDEFYNIVLLNTNPDNKILGKNIKARIKEAGVHHMVGEVLD